MTLKVASKRESSEAPEMAAIVLENVSWETFERLMRDLDGRRLRLTYDDGRLALSAPISSRHEREKSLLNRMIGVVALEMSIPIADLGSTTGKRKKLLKAIEPDECWYVLNEPKVRGKFNIDLRRDPPPDFVLE